MAQTTYSKMPGNPKTDRIFVAVCAAAGCAGNIRNLLGRHQKVLPSVISILVTYLTVVIISLGVQVYHGPVYHKQKLHIKLQQTNLLFKIMDRNLLHAMNALI
jgi:hypothetical protein